MSDKHVAEANAPVNNTGNAPSHVGAGDLWEEAGAQSVAQATTSREKFGSRLGFLLISAGCAIGLGNVWRFPYITGEYGGAAFVLLYLIFLVILGLPVMVMEFAVGRASQRSSALAFDALQPKRSWHWFSWWCKTS